VQNCQAAFAAVGLPAALGAQICGIYVQTAAKGEDNVPVLRNTQSGVTLTYSNAVAFPLELFDAAPGTGISTSQTLVTSSGQFYYFGNVTGAANVTYNGMMYPILNASTPVYSNGFNPANAFNTGSWQTYLDVLTDFIFGFVLPMTTTNCATSTHCTTVTVYNHIVQNVAIQFNCFTIPSPPGVASPPPLPPPPPHPPSPPMSPPPSPPRSPPPSPSPPPPPVQPPPFPPLTGTQVLSGTLQLDGSVYTPLFVSTFDDRQLLINTLSAQLGIPPNELQLTGITQNGVNVVINYAVRVPGGQIIQTQNNVNNLKLANIYETYPLIEGLTVGATSVTVAPPAPPSPPLAPPTPPAPPHKANEGTVQMVFYVVLGVSVGAVVVCGVIGCVVCWPRRMKRTKARRTHKDELRQELLAA
jgi:hypothetical protein